DETSTVLGVRRGVCGDDAFDRTLTELVLGLSLQRLGDAAVGDELRCRHPHPREDATPSPMKDERMVALQCVKTSKNPCASWERSPARGGLAVGVSWPPRSMSDIISAKANNPRSIGTRGRPSQR